MIHDLIITLFLSWASYIAYINALTTLHSHVMWSLMSIEGLVSSLLLLFNLNSFNYLLAKLS
jgi:hypothetical protein